MLIERQRPVSSAFNTVAQLPFELRIEDFSLAMQDVYDFFFDVNSFLIKKGLQRLDDMLRPAIMSGLLSDVLTSSLAKHSRTLVQNQHFNGHPDLLVKGAYPNDAAKAGVEGVEIKTTRKAGGAVDTHGAREQWMTVFVYAIDDKTEPPETGRRFALPKCIWVTLRLPISAKTLVVNSVPAQPLCIAKAFSSCGKAGSIAIQTRRAASRGMASLATRKYSASRSMPILS